MAQNRIWSRGEDGGHPAAMPRHVPMPNRIGAGMDAVKPSSADSPLDLFLAPAFFQQLPPPHNPMLPLRKGR